MKIAVLGFSGSGKSTLAKKLAEHHGIPVLYLDTVQWLPGWVAQKKEIKDAKIREFLDTHAEWVIDGNYSRFSFERRMEEADQIVILRFGRIACLWRAFRRQVKYRGRSRESMTVGCPEKMDREFIRWILRDGRTKQACGRLDGIVSQYAEKTVVLKNQRQLTAFERRKFIK